MDLKKTYEQTAIHEDWVSVYRSNPLQERFNEIIIERVLDLLQAKPDDLFLDAGCGTGHHIRRISQRGHRCIGVDLSLFALKEAARQLAGQGLDSLTSFAVEKLEALSFEDASFDVVHCRGVLMHIPQWERALKELCRVLKPGGRLVIFEANLRSLETMIVRLVRRVSRRESRMVDTPGGLEFWKELDGQPFVARAVNIQYLCDRLVSHGLNVRHMIATEFWDINRFPTGPVRNGVIRFNSAWFSLRLPSWPSQGTAIIGVKR